MSKSTTAQLVVLAKMSFGWRLGRNLRGNVGKCWLEKIGVRRSGEPLWIDVSVKTADVLFDAGLIEAHGLTAFGGHYLITKEGLAAVKAARMDAREPPMRITKAVRTATRAVDGGRPPPENADR